MTEVRGHIRGARRARSVDITSNAWPSPAATRLLTQFDIEHSTFQLETQDRQPLEEAVHP